MNMRTEPQNHEAEALPPSQLSVLVVDDSATERMRITNLVRKLGYPVEEAVDGEDALTKLNATAHRLIITDLNMSNVDGFQLCRKIRSAEMFGEPYIIMLSAQTYVYWTWTRA